MKTSLALLALIVIAMAAIGFLMRKLRPLSARPVAQRRRLMTQREEAMYNRLVSALPHYYVLAQVSFGALLTARRWRDRNRFDRKIADFVLCDRALRPAAVIELDDASHHHKQASDLLRDQLLQHAGYRVVRYANIPDASRLQADFPEQITPTPVGAPQ